MNRSERRVLAGAPRFMVSAQFKKEPGTAEQMPVLRQGFRRDVPAELRAFEMNFFDGLIGGSLGGF